MPAILVGGEHVTAIFGQITLLNCTVLKVDGAPQLLHLRKELLISACIYADIAECLWDCSSRRREYHELAMCEIQWVCV
jgi:hypothetical protein